MADANYNKAYYEKNKEQLREYAKERYRSHRKEYREYWLKTKEYQHSRYKRYESENKVEIRERQRRRTLMKKFGITLEDYDSMLKSQNGGCAICGRKDPGSKKVKYFFVDHNHNTNKVRGLLCNQCNRAIGYLRDDPDVVYAAAMYLRKHKVSQC